MDFILFRPCWARQKIAELQLSGGELYSTDGDFGEAYPGYFWKSEIDSPDFSEHQYLSVI